MSGSLARKWGIPKEGLPATGSPRESWPMSKSVIGDSPRRREDARFVTGRGAYVDDLACDRLTRAVFVRSPHAHARLRSIDTAAAQRAPGVLAVLTAADVKRDGLK